MYPHGEKIPTNLFFISSLIVCWGGGGGGGRQKHTVHPPPFHLYITALVQISVVWVCLLFDTHGYGTSCWVWAVCYCKTDWWTVQCHFDFVTKVSFWNIFSYPLMWWAGLQEINVSHGWRIERERSVLAQNFAAWQNESQMFFGAHKRLSMSSLLVI
jgi:hypothetical protein